MGRSMFQKHNLFDTMDLTSAMYPVVGHYQSQFLVLVKSINKVTWLWYGLNIVKSHIQPSSDKPTIIIND